MLRWYHIMYVMWILTPNSIVYIIWCKLNKNCTKSPSIANRCATINVSALKTHNTKSQSQYRIVWIINWWEGFQEHVICLDPSTYCLTATIATMPTIRIRLSMQSPSRVIGLPATTSPKSVAPSRACLYDGTSRRAWFAIDTWPPTNVHIVEFQIFDTKINIIKK